MVRWLHVSNHRGSSGADRNSKDKSPVAYSKCDHNIDRNPGGSRNATGTNQLQTFKDSLDTDSSGICCDATTSTNLAGKRSRSTEKMRTEASTLSKSAEKPANKFRLANRVFEKASYRLCSGQKSGYNPSSQHISHSDYIDECSEITNECEISSLPSHSSCKNANNNEETD